MDGKYKTWNLNGVLVSEVDDVEWQAYAGLEKFSDGSRPVITESEGSDSLPACVVLGGHDGIHVLCGSEGEREYAFLQGNKCALTQNMAAILVADVIREIMPKVPAVLSLDKEADVFGRYGFYQIR